MPKPYSVGSVSDLIVFLPDNVERVLASQFHHQHDLMALDGAPMKSLLPGHTCQTLFSWFRVQNKCDDPVHGSGPGEIVFHHMSVVQRGVRSRELPPPQPETACCITPWPHMPGRSAGRAPCKGYWPLIGSKKGRIRLQPG